MTFPAFDDWLEAHSGGVAGLIIALACLVRLRLAAGTYLNPDEALHFFMANRASLKLAYRSSLTLSHPPLLILVLYYWKGLGTSEWILRLPSVAAGTAFCWAGFRWMGMLFDRATAWTALVFFAFLPSTIALSIEVRQYAFVLAFGALSAYFLERALSENRIAQMALSALCLYLAMLSHYSAFLFAATLGVYALLRMLDRHPTARLAVAWGVGQAGGVALAVLLYLTHLRTLGQNYGGASATQGWMRDSYLLNSYFDPQRMNILRFTFARTGGVFQYVFGQLAMGDLAFLLFLAGVWLLSEEAAKAAKAAKTGKAKPGSRLLAGFLLLPFALNWMAAVAGRYPYGGTRHSSFLLSFAVAGVSVLLSRLSRGHAARALLMALVGVGVANAFPSHRQPYLSRANQSRARMEETLAFIREQIPREDPIFVDYQTSLVLCHYLCQMQQVTFDHPFAGFRTTRCAGHTIIATTSETYIFGPRSLVENWNRMRASFLLAPGTQLWVIQQGWNIRLGTLSDLGPFRAVSVHRFGANLALFPLKVGEPMPNPDSLPD
jgi:hypothetical protein